MILGYYGKKAISSQFLEICFTLVYSCISKQERSKSGYQSRLLGIRSRNEEAVNSTRNTMYSLKVFYFLLYRRRYFLFVSELI